MAKAAIEDRIAGIDRQTLVDAYKLMVLIRRFEESTYRKFREGKMGGYLHRYDGQEALVAAIVPQLRLPGDYILCTYRDHAHALACGTPADAVMAELLGRATGCAGGKGGSMHLIDPERGFLGGDGIVGGPVPISTGVGWALKYRGEGGVCACYFGDGAMNQGGVHEAMNMAALYGLPVLYILENNHYAMGTALSRSTGQTDFVAKAAAHGIPGERVDGMDYFAVHDAAARALKAIRATGKPQFLEMQCYRFVGHGIGDDNTQGTKFYRPDEELAEWKKRDPIELMHRRLLDERVLADADFEAIDEDARSTVESAITFAEASPEPDMDSLYDHVFS